MLVTMKPMLIEAQKEKYAVIAANVGDEITVRAVIDAATELRSPVILNVAYVATKNLKEFGRICEAAAWKANVPVAINLDHGEDFNQCIESIAAGFSSMMADRSNLSYEDNVREVALLARIAHAAGMSIEAELGHVGDAIAMGEDYSSLYTDPEQAARYVEETGIDHLAVAIGTAHGAYPEGFKPSIDFNRLGEIRERVSIPLVLHGGSSSGDAALHRCAKNGISKINIATDDYLAGIAAAENHTPDFPYDYFDQFYDGFNKSVKHYMEVFDSVGRVR